MPGQSRQPLLAFVLSHVASAVIFVFTLFTLYHIFILLRRFHSLPPTSTLPRYQSPLSRRLLVGEKDHKTELTGSDGLGILTPAHKADSDNSPQYPFNMAARQGDAEHNPLRPKARTPTPHSGPSATVSLSQGRYTGVHLPPGPLIPRAVEAWRGIPYAETTGGANRFRPPVPLRRMRTGAASSSGEEEEEEEGKKIFRADTWGAMCPGSAARVPGMLDGEDCLNLNVYRQARYDPARDGKMPVVVYVHGGAFNGGAGTERDMASFVGWSETPIVGVNFNYRVGALGFPSSAAAEGEGALNLGLKDQRLLFEWVRENVGEFGGDRDRVTLIGLSAGAHSVSRDGFRSCPVTLMNGMEGGCSAFSLCRVPPPI